MVFRLNNASKHLATGLPRTIRRSYRNVLQCHGRFDVTGSRIVKLRHERIVAYVLHSGQAPGIFV